MSWVSILGLTIGVFIGGIIAGLLIFAIDEWENWRIERHFNRMKKQREKNAVK